VHSNSAGARRTLQLIGKPYRFEQSKRNKSKGAQPGRRKPSLVSPTEFNDQRQLRPATPSWEIARLPPEIASVALYSYRRMDFGSGGGSKQTDRSRSDHAGIHLNDFSHRARGETLRDLGSVLTTS